MAGRARAHGILMPGPMMLINVETVITLPDNDDQG